MKTLKIVYDFIYNLFFGERIPRAVAFYNGKLQTMPQVVVPMCRCGCLYAPEFEIWNRQWRTYCLQCGSIDGAAVINCDCGFCWACDRDY